MIKIAYCKKCGNLAYKPSIGKRYVCRSRNCLMLYLEGRDIVWKNRRDLKKSKVKKCIRKTRRIGKGLRN